MVSREAEAELLGRTVEFKYSEQWLGYSILGLRAVMAWVFVQAGLEKIVANVIGDGWTSVHFLEGVSGANPFAELFYFFAQYPGIVDPLVMYGQLLIGIALFLGLFFRFAALMGGIQMLLFWTASFQGGFLAGLPVAHGFVVNQDTVYMLLLFGLGAWGAGRILGLDRKLEDLDFVEENSWLKLLLG